MKTTVSAVDFGTSKIVALVAETSGRQRCDIIGAGTVIYDGYLEGRWNAPDLLNDAIQNALHAAEEQARARIKDVFVGVPGDFSQVRTVEVQVELQGADPRVTQRDIEALFDKAVQNLGSVRGTIIQRSPAWFTVDDGKKTFEPMGMRGYVLRGMVSFVIADQFFLEDVSARFRSLGINVAGFMSVPQGQAMLFVPDEERDHTAVLVDVGYLTTEVMILEGDAITYLKNLPLGGGHIAADLAYGLKITLPVAEQIKRAYVYGLSAGQASFDGTDQAGNTATFTREQVEAVLEPRAEEICEKIKDAIQESGAKLGKWSPVYLTGGGLAINRGGRDFLAHVLDRTVRELPRKAVKLSSPAYSSALGLLDLLIDNVTESRATSGVSGFFRSLFGG